MYCCVKLFHNGSHSNELVIKFFNSFLLQ
uniref:Uncharacterized protein n=1 Tax=Arundo donax TaxID=35708 RepID=A0A0A8YRR7_ARUDO